METPQLAALLLLLLLWVPAKLALAVQQKRWQCCCCCCSQGLALLRLLLLLQGACVAARHCRCFPVLAPSRTRVQQRQQQQPCPCVAAPALLLALELQQRLQSLPPPLLLQQPTHLRRSALLLPARPAFALLTWPSVHLMGTAHQTPTRI